MSVVQGKCHCGQVEIEVKLQEKNHVICHCGACQMTSGSDYTENQIVAQEDLNIKKGALTKYTYHADSGNPVHCYFCSTCGSHVYLHQTFRGPKYVVRTALLEGSKSWPIAAEIYKKDSAPWQPNIAEAVFEAMPPS
ncbi:hypothetical protein FQN57_004524 [Myotisia sp. PD_48]|nr:hypothetical protein FQN57_004524 [Myotisia sp. PD_48]